MSHSRPLKCLGWWGNCPLLAAFPPASWSRDLVEGRPRTLIDPLLRFLSFSSLPASNPKPSIKRWTWNLRFSISDLEGQLRLLNVLVGLAWNRELSAGFFPPHGYL